MKMQQQTLIKTTREYRVELSRSDILKLIEGPIPTDARVYITVPGGADWSNTDLHIDEDMPVIVGWTLEHTEFS